MVVHLTQAKDEEGRKVGVQAHKKNRAAHVDPRRIVRFNLEDGNIKLLTGRILFGSCEESLIQILFKA